MNQIAREEHILKDQGRSRVTNLEDGTREYRDWHRTLDRHLYANDIDQIEWRSGPDGKPFPVALMELTEIRINTPNLMDQILDRFEVKTSQAEFSRTIADKLGVNAYIVAYAAGLNYFFLYNLSEKKGWVRFSQAQYKHWLSLLTVKNAKRLQKMRKNQ